MHCIFFPYSFWLCGVKHIRNGLIEGKKDVSGRITFSGHVTFKKGRFAKFWIWKLKLKMRTNILFKI